MATKEPYNGLTEDQWLDIAHQLYFHETITNTNNDSVPLMPRGSLNSFGRGRKATLEGMLQLAVVGSKRATDFVPHYDNVIKVYQSVISNCVHDKS
ncbi:MAG: hypothetical protein ACMXYL_01115 [Candidatus Woesearchaeota archaeon]